jgi:putative membrane protein
MKGGREAGVAIIERLADFGEFFGLALALVILYLVVYVLATQHNELALIRANVLSAAIALGMSLIGFALPLSSAIVYTRNLGHFIMWGVVALVVQILVYWLVRLVLPDLSRRIAAGEVTAALFLGCASLAAGIINAAAMSF